MNSVIEKLEEWRTHAIDGLRDGTVELQRKLEIDDAIAILRRLNGLQVNANACFTVLPEQGTRTPSSAYRVLEDHESNVQSHWVEVNVGGRKLKLHEGDIIIEIDRN